MKTLTSHAQTRINATYALNSSLAIKEIAIIVKAVPIVPTISSAKRQNNDDNICSFEPFTHKWSVGFGFSMLAVFVAGIGGRLFVSIMILLFDFPSNHAIPSSKALIFGGSLAVIIFNLPKKHNFYQRPFITYNVAAMIEPTSMASVWNAVQLW
jgi:uncharacterized membrane protein YfcA